MQKIKTLPPDIVAKIAAGEVIERPFYVIKELVENAIDAHASIIQVHVEEAGLKRIKVIDNGEGMSKEDIQVCFFPHTTSKITSSDIVGIQTLGFRGEALSAIAAIGDISIQSRLDEDAGGWSIAIFNGVVMDVEPAGLPKGTIITVSDLFSRIPARKKFLRSHQTEFRYITDLMTKFALSYPTIHFVLTHNAKTILDIPRRDTLPERLRTLLGVSLVNQLVPLSFEDGYIRIEGFIGTPEVASKNNTKQFLFVNNRLVADRLIAAAVKEAYGSLIPSINTPVFLLYLTLPFEFVDVNVHPRKEQIAFIDAKMIFDAVKLAVTETLASTNISFQLSKFQNDSLRKGETRSFSAQLLKQHMHPPKNWASKQQSVIQVDNTYIVSSAADEVVIIDQHAAHERILYEKYLALYTEGLNKNERVVLSKPITLSLSLSENQLVDEYEEDFIKLGFSLEHFQEKTFIIKEIPSVMKGRNIEKIFADMLSDLSEKGSLSSIDTRSKRMLAFLSCRSAVMAGQVLDMDEMKQIINDLWVTPNNTTCPHGRPTTIHISVAELKTAFKR